MFSSKLCLRYLPKVGDLRRNPVESFITDKSWLIWMVIRPRVSDCQQLRGDFDEQDSEVEAMHSAAASP